MTIEALNAIKDEVVTLESSLADLAVKITEAEDNGVVVPSSVDDAYAQMGVSLKVILDWVEQAITDGTEEPALGAMSAFLLELKEIFEKYSATIETIVSGYGEGYGSPSGLRLTITYENVTDSVEFMKNSLHSADLG